MYVAARVRLVLARRPWIYWLGVAALSVLVAVAIHGRLAAIERERSDWGATRIVLMAVGPLEPGHAPTVRRVELPIAALPEDALTDLEPDARMRQRAADGEVLTSFDIVSGPGPAAAADAGDVVVTVSDPLARNVVVGTTVRVVADGLVLARSGHVVEVIDDVVFVAVDEIDGPVVAAAAQQGIASLLYLPDDG